MILPGSALVATLERRCVADPSVAFRMCASHGGDEIGCKRGDAAFARQVIAHEGDFSNFRDFFG
jgi:hypothetical protein